MRNAFTLIELLIVVAIIGILAVIALPNFINAQLKAKVALCLSNMRSVGTALEMYYLDKKTYPRYAWDSIYNPDAHYMGFRDLTSPVVYIQQSALKNPFISNTQKDEYFTNTGDELDSFFEMGTFQWNGIIQYPYTFIRTKFPKDIWLLESSGPDGGDNYDTKIYPYLTLRYHSNEGPVYQASNGLFSRGDIFMGGGVYVADWVKNSKY